MRIEKSLYTGSGIYRDVHLITANPVHIDLWGVYYTAHGISSKKATLDVKTTVQNHEAGQVDVTVKHQLVNANGKVVVTGGDNMQIAENSQSTASVQLAVNNPTLWGLEQPHLYRLKTTILKKDKIVDENMTHVGIRSLGFDADTGFSLNGKFLKIKGVCLHHDAGVLGSAVPKEVWRDRVLKLKEIGCNGIRMGHNPQATDV